MTRLFRRNWSVKVDTIKIENSLDVSFNVQKTTKREPNKCSLKIWNLTENHRKHLESLSTRKQKGSGRIRVEIEAGYGDHKGLIFRGDLRNAKTTVEGADFITELEGEDGGRSSLTSRVNRAFPPGTKVDTVIKACAESMGVGIGNTVDVVTGARLELAGATFTDGTVLSGSASSELEKILRSVGLRYSIQNGVLQIIERGGSLQSTAVRLTSGTGLIGIPVVNFDGTVSVTALLNHDIYPGRRIVFGPNGPSGVWRAEQVGYTGDSFGNEWYTPIEAKPL